MWSYDFPLEHLTAGSLFLFGVTSYDAYMAACNLFFFDKDAIPTSSSCSRCKFCCPMAVLDINGQSFHVREYSTLCLLHILSYDVYYLLRLKVFIYCVLFNFFRTSSTHSSASLRHSTCYCCSSMAYLELCAMACPCVTSWMPG